jgi:ABC-2 type transport system permease protein
MTKNQVIAFIVSVVICFAFLLWGFLAQMFSGWAPAFVVDAIASLSFLTHFDALSKGVIDLRDIVFFLLVIGAWLAANTIVLDMKKAD